MFRASLELQKQALLNAYMQPFYSHIPYILQFFIQYDIFGMDLVHFDEKHVHFRSPPSNLALSGPLNFWTSPLLPSTRMQVEFDVFEDSILNSSLLTNSNYLNACLSQNLVVYAYSLGQFVNAGLKLIYTEELARANNGEIVGLSPEGFRNISEVSENEREYLDKLRDFCARCIQEPVDPTNSDSASSQLDAFSQGFFILFTMSFLDNELIVLVNETILMNPERGNVNLLDEQPNQDDFDMWNDMEMQMRGFDVEEVFFLVSLLFGYSNV
jgi:hypothetical protein